VAGTGATGARSRLWRCGGLRCGRRTGSARVHSLVKLARCRAWYPQFVRGYTGECHEHRFLYLYDNFSLQNGVAILQAFDKISPGCVAWRRVSKPKIGAEAASPTRAEFPEGEEEEETGVTPNMAKLSRFKCVENANYAVDLGKQNGMHLVGIQGSDIVDAKKTLVLGLTWQLMRCVSDSVSTSHLTHLIL
jgi:hypothetical protein